MNAKAALLLELTEGLGAGAVVVEVGTMRFGHEAPSDGASTLYLARRAKERGWKFVSIDNDEAAFLNAAKVLRVHDLQAVADLRLDDGAIVLANLIGPIDFLYLDGAADPGEALAQFEAAEHRIAPWAVVAIDDIQEIRPGEPLGKGERLLPALEARGWTVEVRPTEPGYAMAICRRLS